MTDLLRRRFAEPETLSQQYEIALPTADDEPRLVVDVDGFEGPLDLLLALARSQKVDLIRISIVALADQYLAFIEQARRERLELAADYLVMAAWLAYLKSRLLIPDKRRDDEPPVEELALLLAKRLERLEKIRRAADLLREAPHLHRDFFARGAPEVLAEAEGTAWTASLYDLLEAYGRQRQHQANARVRVARRTVISLAEAREALTRMLGHITDWTCIDEYLLDYLAVEADRASIKASSFAASLELVREGHIRLRQDKAFAPLWVRPHRPEGDA